MGARTAKGRWHRVNEFDGHKVSRVEDQQQQQQQISLMLFSFLRWAGRSIPVVTEKVL